jgi:hypothetical protein
VDHFQIVLMGFDETDSFDFVRIRSIQKAGPVLRVLRESVTGEKKKANPLG